MVQKPQLVVAKFELFATNLANKLHKCILTLFPKCIEYVKKLVWIPWGFRKNWKNPFTTMGIINNFVSPPHLNKGDSIFNFMCFCNCKNKPKVLTWGDIRTRWSNQVAWPNMVDHSSRTLLKSQLICQHNFFINYYDPKDVALYYYVKVNSLQIQFLNSLKTFKKPTK